MKHNIDIRALKLNKWYVPKTVSLENIENDTDIQSYVAIGYFDAVQIKGLSEKYGDEHPFIGGYKTMVEWKEKEKVGLVDFSSQEQLLFIDICDKPNDTGASFTKEQINGFWNDTSSPYLFLSMIHINHIGNLKKALKGINTIFQKDYLAYISFDYCDIVLFAKNTNMTQYLYNIQKLFDNVPYKKDVIFDTFSLASFYPKYAINAKNQNLQNDNGNDNFSATINLSIHDCHGFNMMSNHSSCFNENIKKSQMFGRHDISLIKDEADTKWLLEIMQELHNQNNQRLFWTFETYIKTNIFHPQEETNKNSHNETIRKSKDKTYNKRKKQYDKICTKLKERISELKNSIEDAELTDARGFMFPVYEVRDCICSIVKNNFAEELVYCVYESFLNFIKYMTKKFETLASYEENERVKIEEEITYCYNQYFTALNTIVNSTMHNERQFVQATAFNAIFYSIPPKILAFYNAYIYNMKKLLCDKGNIGEFTYFICPSFSPIMSIEMISPNDEPPCERILMISISEKTLYDVAVVSYQLIHELAHYIGEEIRCRRQRKQSVINSLIEFIAVMCDINDRDIVMQLKKYAMDEMCNEYFNYFIKFQQDSISFVKELDTDSSDKLSEYLMESVTETRSENCYDHGLEQIGLINQNDQQKYRIYYKEQYSRQKSQEISNKLDHLHDDENVRNYKLFIELLESIYRETYADLQMLLVLAVNPYDYLSMFIQKIGVSLDNLLCNLADAIRVGIIFKIMTACGFWETDKLKFNDERLSDEINNLLKNVDEACAEVEKSNIIVDLLNEIQQISKTYKNDIDEHISFSDDTELMTNDDEKYEKYFSLEDYNFVLCDLYSYLLHVTKEFLLKYDFLEKKEGIAKIRRTIKTLLDFNSIESVFNCVEKEMQEYWDVLLKQD